MQYRFNSYTQEICVDNAVVGISDTEDSQPVQGVPTIPVVGDGKTTRDQPVGTVVTVPKTPASEVITRNLPTETSPYPSQIVTYYSKYVDKVSDVSNDMNISGSLSIKYGAISGGGSGSYVDVETFQNSDMNFLISVKVINQTINVKDQLAFWPLGIDKNRTLTPAQFTNTYGDSFISGFQEGGSFYAVVSIKALDSTMKNEIKASAHLALQVGVGEVEADGSVALAKSELQKNSEVNITVNWSGGGQLKEGGDKWDIDTLTEVAVRFPDLVASCPQRTHAILTKYTALRGYLEWKGLNNPLPLDYDLASLYTCELLDVYMGYKVIWDSIHTTMEDMDNGVVYVKAPNPTSEVRGPQVPTNANETAWQPGPILRPFDATYVGLDLALGTCRNFMVRIVREVDAITMNPLLAVDPNRPNAYLRPQVFKLLLPIKYVPPPPPEPVANDTDSQVIQFPGFDSQDFPNPTISKDLPMTFPAKKVPPSVAVGFNQINSFRGPKRLRLKSYAQQVGLAGGTITTTVASDAANDTAYALYAKTFGNSTTALAIAANDDLVQTGTYTLPWQLTDTRSGGTAPKDRTQTIYFDQTYDAVPTVMVWLSGFDRYSSDDPDVGVTADAVSTTSFTARFHSDAGELYNATVTWIAIPSGRRGVACGNSDPVTVSRNGPQLSDVQGHVVFPSGTFTTAPLILVCLSGFHFLHFADFRLECSAGEVTKAGFNWHARTWADTRMYGAAVGWIALAQ